MTVLHGKRTSRIRYAPGWKIAVVFVLLPATAALAATPDTVLVKEHGATGDGSTDDSGAIQKALAAAAARGGGVVELGIGRFRMDHAVTVPEGVTLKGVWEVPHHAQLDKGTVIEVYAGRGEQDGPPLIKLSPSSAVRGVTFFYPEQRVPGTVGYPWTIQGEGMHGSVIDCTFVNAYQAIDFATYPNELHYIRNCFGCPLKAGIRIDKCTDIGRIENVHFNPHYWLRSGGRHLPAWSALRAYLLENLVAFEFGWTDWEYVHDTFCYGAKIGYRFIASGGRTVNGNFLGIGADWCERAVLVEESQMPGLLITNGEFVGARGARVMLEVAASHTGVVQLSNCSFWGPSPVAARVDGTGTASFNQCTFFNHGGGPSRDQDPAQADAYTLEILGGVGLIHGCRFGVDRPDVMLGERVTAATITGNAFLGGKQITTQTDGDVQEGFNVVVPMRPRTRPAKKEDGP